MRITAREGFTTCILRPGQRGPRYNFEFTSARFAFVINDLSMYNDTGLVQLPRRACARPHSPLSSTCCRCWTGVRQLTDSVTETTGSGSAAVHMVQVGTGGMVCTVRMLFEWYTVHPQRGASSPGARAHAPSTDGTECGKRSEGLARMAKEDGSTLQPLAHRGGLQERLSIQAGRRRG